MMVKVKREMRMGLSWLTDGGRVEVGLAAGFGLVSGGG